MDAMRATALALATGAVALLPGPRPAIGAEAGRPEGSDVSWFDGNTLDLTLSAPDGGETTYRFEVCTGGDLRIEQDAVGATGRAVGTMMVLGGRVLAVRGLELEPGFEIDAPDAAGLMWQLAAQLLARAAPAGPGAVTVREEVSVAEPSASIAVSTSSAGGEFSAPWEVGGSIGPEEGGGVGFDLDFAWGIDSEGSPAGSLGLSGRWALVSPAPEIPGETSLEGWSLFALGPIHRTIEGAEIFDYGATPLEQSFETVAALREDLAGE